MKKHGRYGKFGETRRLDALRKGKQLQSLFDRELYKLDEHIKISPKHPNRGRR